MILSPGPGKHIDPKKVEEQKKNLAALRELIELNDEEGYVALIKVIDPNITPEKLVGAIRLFREEQKKRSH